MDPYVLNLGGDGLFASQRFFSAGHRKVTIGAFESQEFTITFSPILPKKKWIALASCYVDDIHEAAVLPLAWVSPVRAVPVPVYRNTGKTIFVSVVLGCIEADFCKYGGSC